MDETFKALKPSPLRKGHSRGRAGRRWGLTRLVPPRGGTCPLHSADTPQTHCPCRGEERPGGGGGPEARRERPRRRRPHRLRLRLRSRGTASSRSPAGSGGARRPRPAGASPSARGVPGGRAEELGRWPLATRGPLSLRTHPSAGTGSRATKTQLTVSTATRLYFVQRKLFSPLPVNEEMRSPSSPRRQLPAPAAWEPGVYRRRREAAPLPARRCQRCPAGARAAARAALASLHRAQSRAQPQPPTPGVPGVGRRRGPRGVRRTAPAMSRGRRLRGLGCRSRPPRGEGPKSLGCRQPPGLPALARGALHLPLTVGAQRSPLTEAELALVDPFSKKVQAPGLPTWVSRPQASREPWATDGQEEAEAGGPPQPV